MKLAEQLLSLLEAKLTKEEIDFLRWLDDNESALSSSIHAEIDDYKDLSFKQETDDLTDSEQDEVQTELDELKDWIKIRLKGDMPKLITKYNKENHKKFKPSNMSNIINDFLSRI